ncbi:hypothetical protein [Thiocystis violacea]|uniref:hypothetical protein n=1 Tax=Thiocystis violacea TaxID=13725 RepID=UPI0019089C38|nr:hypothetical protein [Thiocystis violacea]MBK1723151.1 hypothetical protein [Thiocystis violacea]
MDYDHILAALNQASLFELYRLSAAISNQLDDPARIRAVKQALRVGQTLSWFDNVENRLVEARLVQINRTRALVQNIADGKRWSIPFYQINLEGKDAEIGATKRRGLDRNSVKVGDRVAFRDRNGLDRFGEVVKLNQKTAAVLVGATRWRVGYGLLSHVIDGNLGDDTLALPGTWTRITDDAEEDTDPRSDQGADEAPL